VQPSRKTSALGVVSWVVLLKPGDLSPFPPQPIRCIAMFLALI
jgi:hypothetical protein